MVPSVKEIGGKLLEHPLIPVIGNSKVQLFEELKT